MRRPVLFRLACRLLSWLSLSAHGEALCGDLLEEFERTGSGGRFWREILVEGVRGLWGRSGVSLRALVFSTGWSLLYPVWHSMEGGRVWPAMAQRSFAMEWPYSSVTLLASAGLPPLLFVWCGALLYLARNDRAGGWRERWFHVVRGLSLSMSVLLVTTIVMLHARSDGSAGSLTGASRGAGMHLTVAASVPLMLSVLAGALSARPARVRLQAR